MYVIIRRRQKPFIFTRILLVIKYHLKYSQHMKIAGLEASVVELRGA